MLESFQMVGYGLSLALAPENLIYALIGSILGTAVGVLPGLGPATTIAVLLPLTYGLDSPVGALIMLASIYYGSMYGGSTTSILLKVPGEAASVITSIDGYEMAKQGRAGPALGIAAIGSFIAGTFGVIAICIVGPAFARFAVSFGPPEYLALAAFGLVLCSTLSGGPPLRGIAMALAGLVIGLVGVDTMTGTQRFTFGQLALADGITLVPLLMGLFGLGEILYSLEQRGTLSMIRGKIGRLLPSREDWKRSTGPIARGSVMGFLIGLIPGGGAIIGCLLSYAVEKRISKHPEQFGHGAIEGVAGPESANNSAASAAFIPLLTLGLPGNAVTAVLFGGLLIQGVEPGPMILVNHADVFWGVIASMYVGNILLLILNLPLVGIWVQLLRVPFWALAPAVLLVSIFGAYSLRNSMFDIGVLMAAGIAGYFLRKARLDAAPLIMAFILAPLLDTSLRQSLLMGQGSLGFMFTRPFTAILILLIVAALGLQIAAYVRRKRALPA